MGDSPQAGLGQRRLADHLHGPNYSARSPRLQPRAPNKTPAMPDAPANRRRPVSSVGHIPPRYAASLRPWATRFSAPQAQPAFRQRLLVRVPRRARRSRFLDIGTNSTRLLVAEVETAGSLPGAQRRTEVARLGRRRRLAGRLSDERSRRRARHLRRYRQALRRATASSWSVAVLRCAVPSASNGAELERELRQRFGSRPAGPSPASTRHWLDLPRATGSRAAGGRAGVDVGGGGTKELIVRVGRRPQRSSSRRRSAACASPTPSAHRSAPGRGARGIRRGRARSSKAQCLEEGVRRDTSEGIAVAGTPTSLAAIDLKLDPYDSEQVQGHVLTHRSR